MYHRRIRSGGTFRNITLLLQNQNPQISFAQSVSDKGTTYPRSDYRYICHQSYYKIEIEMKNIRFIIIDMDGTLYDMADLIADGFDTAVAYMMEFYEFEKEDAVKTLNDNHIYPYVAADARSTTQFFLSRFIDTHHWDSYRSEHFGYPLIVKEKAMTEEMLKKLADIAPLVLLTNNTRINVSHVLNQIGVSEDVFTEIMCNENENKSPTKAVLMEKLMKEYDVKPEETLSIGDRFDVDAKPMILLGGKALILKKPQYLNKFLQEIEDPRDCEEYQYYD